MGFVMARMVDRIPGFVVSSRVCCSTIHPFLAVSHRVDANVLVVEGWVHEYAIRASVEEFRRNQCERVFTTGGPVEGTGGYTNDYNTRPAMRADLSDQERSFARIGPDGFFACHGSR